METLKRIPFGARVAAAAVTVLVLTIPMVGSTKENPARGHDVESRIKTLHSQLKITAEQEPAWKDVAQAMRDNAKTMTEMRSAQAAEEKSASAPDMINAYAKTMDAHADAIKKFASTFQPLYDRMSETQKKSADAIFRDRVHEAAARKTS